MKINKQNEYMWKVESEKDPQWDYDVIHKKDGSWYCTCESYKWRTSECKHISAVKGFGSSDTVEKCNIALIQAHIDKKEGFTYYNSYPFIMDGRSIRTYNALTTHPYVVATKTIYATELPCKLNTNSFDWKFRHYRTNYIGGWYNEDKGVYEIEVVEIFETLDQALDHAYKHEQFYIWDNNNQKVISVDVLTKLNQLESLKKHEEAGMEYCRKLYPELLTGTAKNACVALFDTHCKEIKALNRRIELLKRDGGVY